MPQSGLLFQVLNLMVTCLFIGFLYHLISVAIATNSLPLSCPKRMKMDFFETQERYRRREMRGWFLLLFRTSVVAGVLWLGWLWGLFKSTQTRRKRILLDSS